MSEKFLSIKEILHEMDKLLDKEATIISKALSEVDDPLYRATLSNILSCIITNKSQLSGLRYIYVFGTPKPTPKDKEKYIKALRESTKLFNEVTKLLQKLSEMEGDPRTKKYIDTMLNLWKFSVKVGKKSLRR